MPAVSPTKRDSPFACVTRCVAGSASTAAAALLAHRLVQAHDRRDAFVGKAPRVFLDAVRPVLALRLTPARGPAERDEEAGHDPRPVTVLHHLVKVVLDEVESAVRQVPVQQPDRLGSGDALRGRVVAWRRRVEPTVKPRSARATKARAGQPLRD